VDIFKIIFRTKQNNTYIYSHQNENPNTYNGKSQDARKQKKSLLKRQRRKDKERKENSPKETSFNF
jgi:hypothetical protein